MSGLENSKINISLKSDDPEKFLYDRFETVPESENKPESDPTGMTEEDKQIIIFGLGRCFMLCQLLGTEYLAGIHKSKFLETAKKLGAEIKITEF